MDVRKTASLIEYSANAIRIHAQVHTVTHTNYKKPRSNQDSHPRTQVESAQVQNKQVSVQSAATSETVKYFWLWLDSRKQCYTYLFLSSTGMTFTNLADVAPPAGETVRQRISDTSQSTLVHWRKETVACT